MLSCNKLSILLTRKCNALWNRQGLSTNTVPTCAWRCSISLVGLPYTVLFSVFSASVLYYSREGVDLYMNSITGVQLQKASTSGQTSAPSQLQRLSASTGSSRMAIVGCNMTTALYVTSWLIATPTVDVDLVTTFAFCDTAVNYSNMQINTTIIVGAQLDDLHCSADMLH